MPATDRERVRDEVATLVGELGADRAALLPILQEIKRRSGAIDAESMQVIADLIGVHPVEVYSVATFYAFLDPSPQGAFTLRLCQTISCDLAGKDVVARALESELGVAFGETTGDGCFTLGWANCIGMCDQGPALLVNDQAYAHVTPESIREIVAQCRRAFAGRPEDGQGPVASTSARTQGNALTFSSIDADESLATALALSRPDIIDTVTASGMKGRGGAGFPTGMKWNLAGSEKAGVKYIICNADEGEPGTFKDRVILSEFPDLLLAGMTIAGRAVGAADGIIYLRGEYAYLRPGLDAAIARRRAAGLLGNDAGGVPGFAFDVSVALGAGAYICGEETALIESLEGFRGEPRDRPPFPVVKGFCGHPTVVNNVETLASAACVFARGADWFRSFGTDRSTGFKLFSVSGDCSAPGVYEFPFGITVAELLDRIGGADAAAVQIGGASGLCIPRKDFDRQVAFEDIPTGGSVIVFGPERDMLAVAENFLEFFVDESCGQCTPCRIGNVKLLAAARRMRHEAVPPQEMTALRELAGTMRVASKCGLGQTSSVAFLSILEHFGDDVAKRATEFQTART
jgi:[NiFe] hydrogenase diaphorase moiety large subunit